MSKLKDKLGEIIVFFTPTGIDSLFVNFPKFEQNEIIIATYGINTLNEAKSRGLDVRIEVPSEKNPSIISALDSFLTEINKKKQRV